MWIFTRYGFYSVTVSTQDRSKVQIRARAKKDLEKLMDFAGKMGIHLHIKTGGVIETPKSDYHYRLIVDRAKWPVLAHALAGDIDYTNFKAQIKDQARHNLYEDVWRTMLSLQYQAERKAASKAQRGFLDLLADDDLPGLPNELEDWEFLPVGDPTDPFYDPGRYGDNSSGPFEEEDLPGYFDD